jgi:hypothetical protein
MLPVDGAAALHLREYDPEVPGDRGYSLVPVVDRHEPVWDAFRYVREVMRWQEDVSKGVLSQPLGSPDAVAFLFPLRPSRREPPDARRHDHAHRHHPALAP